MSRHAKPGAAARKGKPAPGKAGARPGGTRPGGAAKKAGEGAKTAGGKKDAKTRPGAAAVGRKGAPRKSEDASSEKGGKAGKAGKGAPQKSKPKEKGGGDGKYENLCPAMGFVYRGVFME